LNIIYNAIKYTFKGRVDITIDHDYTSPQNAIKISVADTGIGIPLYLLKKLFNFFSTTSEN
jgi:signal transduction histidine kinase